MSVGFLCSLLSRNYSAWRYSGWGKFLWIKKIPFMVLLLALPYQNSWEEYCIHGILQHAYFVDIKDLNPWGKLELWAMLRSYLHLSYSIGKKVISCSLCNMDLSSVTVVWSLSASPALIFCQISSPRTRFPPCSLSDLMVIPEEHGIDGEGHCCHSSTADLEKG